MDKKTFIRELEKSLSVLKEEELRDIVGEYEQHIAMWMKNKDMILEDLKKKQIASYQTSTITNVKVLVNPAMKNFVDMI